MLDFVNKDYLGFLSLDVDLMLHLVLHLRRFGEVAIDLAIHREIDQLAEGRWHQLCSNCCCLLSVHLRLLARRAFRCGVGVWWLQGCLFC